MADITFVIDGVAVTAKTPGDALEMIQLYKKSAAPASTPKTNAPAGNRPATSMDQKVLALATALKDAGNAGVTSPDLAKKVGLSSGKGLSAYINGLKQLIRQAFPGEELLAQRETDGVKRWYAPDPRIEAEALSRCL